MPPIQGFEGARIAAAGRADQVVVLVGHRRQREGGAFFQIGGHGSSQHTGLDAGNAELV